MTEINESLIKAAVIPQPEQPGPQTLQPEEPGPQPPQPEIPPGGPGKPRLPPLDPEPLPTPVPGPTDPGLPRPVSYLDFPVKSAQHNERDPLMQQMPSVTMYSRARPMYHRSKFTFAKVGGLDVRHE